MDFFNSVGSMWEILRLEKTDALLASLIVNLIIYFKILQLEKTAVYCSYSILIGRLLKENLFFKENNVLKPKPKFFLYFFICNMVFDIITNILFIFLLKYSFYIYFVKGYSVLKLLVFMSVITYYIRLDEKYQKKEQESKEYEDECIKKILETNPNFFDFPEPSIQEAQEYVKPKHMNILKVAIYFSVVLLFNVLLHPHFNVR